MPEQKHMLYYMGSLNGDIRLFRQVWRFIKDYLDVGPATIFSAGNFGLGNPHFLDAVSEEIDGLVTIHIAGGNTAKENWEHIPPPEAKFQKIRPGIFVHAFGSCIKIQNFLTLFLGRGQAFPEDFLPYPKNVFYDPRPDDAQIAKTVQFVEKHRPDIVVSHAFPSFVTQKLCANIAKDDLRRKRATDSMIPVLDSIEKVYLTDFPRKTYWFGGSLNIMGKIQRTPSLEFISLCSFIMVHASLASLEITVQSSSFNVQKHLGNLAYV